MASVLGGLVLLVIAMGALGARGAQKRAAASALAREAAADSARRRDSLRIIGLLRSPRGDSALWADARLHQLGLHIEHPTLHTHVVDATLDSAAKLLRRGGVFPTAPIRQVLEGVPEPLSAAQRRRRTALLERLTASETRSRREAERVAERATASVRAAYARDLESRLLDEGLDARVTVSGPNNTTLRLRYILVNRVWAHKMSQGDMLINLRRIGFKKFIITDGYDDTWYWNL